MENICLVYITAANKEEADKIANAILSKRLAACANIFEEVKSMYWWEGKLQKETEALVLLKTKIGLKDKIEKEVKKNHSYSNPCILFVPVEASSKEFKEWIISETI